MKKKLYLLLSATFLLTLCSSNDTSEQNAADSQYGETLTLTNATQISAIVENPKDFVGKTLLVEGTVTGVCEMMGCWIEVEGDTENTILKAKVEEDGAIVFPMTAIGKTAAVEGIIEEITMTKEEVIEQKQRHAEETGEEFDPSTVAGPETTYQLKISGAVIK